MSDPGLRVLVIGSGGREHALAWSLATDQAVARVWVAPGNPGTAAEPKVENVAIGVEQIEQLVTFAQSQQIDLTVVGPEAPLAAGLVDRFTAAGLQAFGPTKAAAQLESSKAFAKQFMLANGIPTAQAASYCDLDEALADLARRPAMAPVVVKADGLAAGKGVIVAQNRAMAQSAVADMLGASRFGSAGNRVLIEDYLAGEEASYMVIADGTDYVALATSQDHKRRDDGDVGPNTGGMGAYSPAPIVDAQLDARVRQDIIEPTLNAMATAGTPVRGFLYAGLMIDSDGNPQVLEFNVRMGDPETQPILLRLRTELSTLLLAACNGQLRGLQATFDPRPAIGVVLAAQGYPGDYPRGEPIKGLAHLAERADLKVFHAGTGEDEQGRLITAGGRVLAVTALGDTLATARDQAYAAIEAIDWPMAFYRRDIGHRAL